MHSFYFVRHGQTDANLQGLMCGSEWDIDLNATGVEQANVAAKILSQRIAQEPVIYCSPLLRARRTAEIVAAPFQAPLILVKDLKEWHLGDWERVPFNDIKHEFLGDADPCNGETRVSFRERVMRAIQNCHPKQPGQDIIVVAHGGVWLALQDVLGLETARMENGVPFHVQKRPEGSWTAERLQPS